MTHIDADVAVAADAGDDVIAERTLYGAEDFSLLGAASLLPRIAGRASAAGLVEHALQAWLHEVSALMTGDEGLHPIEGLQQVLFQRVGLRGNDDDYDHPGNSMLDELLATKRGLPIMLSLLVAELAKRMRLEAWLVPLPGHVLAAVTVPKQGFVVLDAFARGQLVRPSDLAARVGLPESELGSVLLPPEDRGLLWRMLNSVQRAYTLRGDHERVLRTLHRKVLLRPNDVEARLLRAEVLTSLHHAELARTDLDRAQAISGNDDNTMKIIAGARARIEQLDQTLN
jgi:regulator of sirC expression with transglutaminase-like and TPR domain